MTSSTRPLQARKLISDFKPAYGASRIVTVASVEPGSLFVDFPGNPYGAVVAQVVESLSGCSFAVGDSLLAVFPDDSNLAVVIDRVADYAGAAARTNPAPEATQPVSQAAAQLDPLGATSSGSLDITLSLGRVARVAEGAVYVVPQGAVSELAATVAIPLANLEDQVVLLMGAAQAPVIIAQLSDQPVLVGEEASDADLELAAKNISLQASEQLELSCGGSRIRISAAGRVEILGRSVTSRSEGVNKIQGASIQLN